MMYDEHNPEPPENFGHGLLWNRDSETEHLKELLLAAKKYVPESAYGFSNEITLRDQITIALSDESFD